ncbi:SCP2 sterol-binding domain-containing protein [Haloglycomyces albus]|uniref:SCP2 sterol-binding domain-containing protein n=1 Tax=Haloglycomyces albus TaxID=526067 RepID=UPI00046D4470|nr:SCP2 sterol-binding domain-containing protein [Haloglycomyces albus]
MTTAAECHDALEKFGELLASKPKTAKKLSGFDRTLACDVTDLDVSFNGRFDKGKLVDIAEGDNDDAQIRMIVSSDDLQALVDGELDFKKAFTSGQVKVKANMMDMMKLGSAL